MGAGNVEFAGGETAVESPDVVARRAEGPVDGLPAQATRGFGPAAVLALQRGAGNRATTAWLRERPPPLENNRERRLARCPGPCRCGGKGGVEPWVEEDDAGLSDLLRQAVIQRATVHAAATTPAVRPAKRRPANTLRRAPATLLQRQPCRPFIDEPELAGGRVTGIGAHTAISEDFVSQVGSGARRLEIPGGSFSPYRTDTCNDPHPRIVSPVAYGGKAGDGIPDLVYQQGGQVEIAEIKPGDLLCYYDGEKQVENYFHKANMRDAEHRKIYDRWRRSEGIKRVELMTPERFVPTSPLEVEGRHISVTWCGPGIILYKPLAHPEVFVCKYLGDQGQVDIFLERTLSRAQGEIDGYIDKILDPAITQAIEKLSLRDAVRLLLKGARSALREYLAKQIGGQSADILSSLGLEGLSDDELAEYIARFIEQRLGPEAEHVLRVLAKSIKSEVLLRARLWLQKHLRQVLQESLTVECAAVFSVSAAMLLRHLLKNLPRLVGRAVVEVIVDAVQEAVRELAKDVGIALLAAAAAAAIIFFLPEEILAGIGAGLLAALRALVAALPRLIPALIPVAG